MKTRNVFLAAASGTAAMTVFSYLISRKKNKDFREPRLLGKMVYRAMPEIKKPEAKVIGWILHCTTGLTFAIIYKFLLQDTKLKSNVPDGIALGLANGLVAVGIWKATFSLHPDPPQIHFNDFYMHLILAHVVFSTTTLCTLNDDK
ncbi:MAG TPA: hypothetical protein VLI68_01460 [Hanamia sp.]|jgi:hypothetical protein|nr:hypothetical protein [Hanamia sp.]